jgi:hypothetical protein
MDFRETWREIVAGALWIWDWAHGRERRVDRGVWREVHLGEALGRGRPSRMQGDEVGVEGLPPVEDDGERAAPDCDGWIGRHRTGYAKVDTRAYPFLSLELAHERRREKSEALEVQIERELERRGYGLGKFISVSDTRTVAQFHHCLPFRYSATDKRCRGRPASWTSTQTAEVLVAQYVRPVLSNR